MYSAYKECESSSYINYKYNVLIVHSSFKYFIFFILNYQNLLENICNLKV
jgi:hypothetical protein